MNNRQCLECHEMLHGRADQKFCNDQCRSAFNNRQSIASNNVIRMINRILRKNYTILSVLNRGTRSTVSRNELLKKGFRFDYFTGTFLNQRSKLFYFCYDQGYSDQENNKLMIIKRDFNGDLAGLSPEYDKIQKTKNQP